MTTPTLRYRRKDGLKLQTRNGTRPGACKRSTNLSYDRCLTAWTRRVSFSRPSSQAGGVSSLYKERVRGRAQLARGVGGGDNLRRCGPTLLPCEALGVSVSVCRENGSSGLRGPWPHPCPSQKQTRIPVLIAPHPANSQLGVRALLQPLGERGGLFLPQPQSSPPPAPPRALAGPAVWERGGLASPGRGPEDGRTPPTRPKGTDYICIALGAETICTWANDAPSD